MIYFRIKNGVDRNKKIRYNIVDRYDKIVTNKKILDYVNSLTIPPAYDDVKIFYDANPKILFQGFDSKGRLQQIYSEAHKKKSMKKKFCHVLDFGKVLPRIKADIAKHMKANIFTTDKIIAIILRIVISCSFRIGNLKYQRLYGSFGISNILKSHISRKGSNLHIEFIGKKGVVNQCLIKDTQLVSEINKLITTKKSNDYVFTHKKNGDNTVITALEINKWLKEYNVNTTTKHFRTWDTNILFIEYMRKSVDPINLTRIQRKKIVSDGMKVISCQINNSPTVCRKEYLHIELLNLYMDKPKEFKKWFFGCNDAKKCFLNYLEKFCN